MVFVIFLFCFLFVFFDFAFPIFFHFSSSFYNCLTFFGVGQIFFFLSFNFFFILVIAGGSGKGKSGTKLSLPKQLEAGAVDEDEDEEEMNAEMESGGTVAGIDSSHFALRFVRTKDGELTYQCGLCGYLPNSTNKSIGYAKSRVCMHIKNVHSEPTNVVCPRCAKKFKNKESLRVHRIKYCRDLAGNLATA